jgi:hypothetical protein
VCCTLGVLVRIREMQIFAMQRGAGEGVGGMRMERPRTAMDCITNTHDTSARKSSPRKRRLSETVLSPIYLLFL